MLTCLLLSHDFEPAWANAFPQEIQFETLDNYEDCAQKLLRKRYDFALLEIDFLLTPKTDPTPLEHFTAIFQALRHNYPHLPLLVLGPLSQTNNLARAVRAGADGYLITPLAPAALQLALDHLQQAKLTQGELTHLRLAQAPIDWAQLGTSQNPALSKQLSQIRALAMTDSPLLLQGEVGVGKEQVARWAHEQSPSRLAAFIQVQCRRAKKQIENELFGYEKGAFQGAQASRLGQVELAHGGTLFLKNIEALSPSAQDKLLQMLRKGVFTRHGGDALMQAKIRLIASSEIDLIASSKAAAFNEDLLYRFQSASFTLPPLRDRLADLPQIIRYILKRLEETYRKGIQGLEPEALDALRNYLFPGNFKELNYLLERAYGLSQPPYIGLSAFPLGGSVPETSPLTPAPPLPLSNLKISAARRRVVAQWEPQYLAALLKEYRGQINHSAAAAGITDRQLRSLMRKHGIRKEAYKIPGK